MIDIHLHSKISFDSEEEPQNYINRAVDLSVPAIGFSEHYDYDAYLDGEKDITLADLDNYSRSICDLRKTNPDIDILKGVEFGYRKEAVNHYQSLINEYDFDYVINSLHTLPDRGDCYHDRFFQNSTLLDSYESYLKGVLESVSANYDFQIVGHIGYVCRYRNGKNSKLIYSDFADIFDEILKNIIRRDKCLEINTSCGVSGCDFLPDKDIIVRYLQLGGKIMSFGSDAHIATNYSNRASELKEFLNSLGINELFYYKSRRLVGYKI